MCLGLIVCVVSLPQFQGCGLLLTQSYAISSREHTAVLFCVWTPCPSLVLLSAFANQRFVSMLGKGLVSPFFSLSCTVEPVSLPLPLSLSPPFSIPSGLPARILIGCLLSAVLGCLHNPGPSLSGCDFQWHGRVTVMHRAALANDKSPPAPPPPRPLPVSSLRRLCNVTVF